LQSVEGGPCFLVVVENLGDGGYLAETPQSSQASLLITVLDLDVLEAEKYTIRGLRCLANVRLDAGGRPMFEACSLPTFNVAKISYETSPSLLACRIKSSTIVGWSGRRETSRLSMT